MPYVKRDNENKVTSLNARFQTGYAEEFLDEDNPEVVAFHYRSTNSIKLKSDTEAKLDAALKKLNVTLTQAEIDAEKTDVQR